MTHPALTAGRAAVVTGAANGIGLAACKRFASLGMSVCMADESEEDLGVAQAAVWAIAKDVGGDVLAVVTDVGRRSDLVALKDAVFGAFGEVAVLMNNAASRIGGNTFDDVDEWRRVVDVNLWGVVDGSQIFAPAMVDQGTPAVIVNTGSKQGITNPPRNFGYNMTKSAVKTFTEGLQHDLRNIDACQVTAHLLVPGWTTRGKAEHKPGAWHPEQVVEVLEAALDRGDFYVICGDDEVTPEMDRTRILWGAGDIVENRPPLSRWHGDYGDAFDTFAKSSP
jgi:NAD(P)-dependent dehydrogenase (short-subunit alcohol dehydrogenase family)